MLVLGERCFVDMVMPFALSLDLAQDVESCSAASIANNDGSQKEAGRCAWSPSRQTGSRDNFCWCCGIVGPQPRRDPQAVPEAGRAAARPRREATRPSAQISTDPEGAGGRAAVRRCHGGCSETQRRSTSCCSRAQEEFQSARRGCPGGPCRGWHCAM